MIELEKDAIVYLLCPPAYASGGPELMHQLGEKLAKYGLNVFMYYHPKHDDPVHPNYKIYGTKYVDVIEDDKKNIIIVPEALVSAFNKIDSYTQIRKCIWWLSVDNFFTKIYKRALPRRIARIPVLRNFRIFENRFFSREVEVRNYNYHLAQSQYALRFLEKKKIAADYLSDYLNPTFFQQVDRLRNVKKEDIVLYNPRKGYKFTEKIMAKCPDIRWIPIRNMTPQEVAELLARAKVYIDFGNHPGKDRFPREAALMNCCIVTGKKGSAKFIEDVNIPKNYKVSDSSVSIGNIIKLVKSCLRDFEQNTAAFEPYREIIRQEEQQFVKDIKSVFIKTEN